MIFILSTGTSALIFISKKCEISDDVIYEGAAPTWPNLTQPDQTIMRYLMTSYVGAAPITSFSRTSGGKLMETVRGNDWKSKDCNDLLLFFLKIPNFSQLWQHREKVVLHNRLELWLWRLGQVTKVTNALKYWLKIVHHGSNSSTLLLWTKKTPFLFSIP